MYEGAYLYQGITYFITVTVDTNLQKSSSLIWLSNMIHAQKVG